MYIDDRNNPNVNVWLQDDKIMYEYHFKFARDIKYEYGEKTALAEYKVYYNNKIFDEGLKKQDVVLTMDNKKYNMEVFSDYIDSFNGRHKSLTEDREVDINLDGAVRI